jgi:lysyl-tRNA synthetase class 1
MGVKERKEQHWADRFTEQLLASRERAREAWTVATGISPSGPFHVGHLREILTGDAVARSLRDRGHPARLVFIVDNLDPLRKVYPFLDPDVYEPLVGRPLVEVPAPDGEGTYDEFFLGPFLQALSKLRVDAEVLRASEMYRRGWMDDVVFTALEQRDWVAEVIERITKREAAPEWSPWNPRCPATGRIVQGRVLEHDRASGRIRFLSPHTGEEVHEGTPRDGGKLTWRVDWPARWKALGVKVEPFGKDHASRGGSYDTGEVLAREVFGVEPPPPLVYEWISLKGQGDMAASKGNVLEPAMLLNMVPPEALRYMVMKARPIRAIRFDPGLPLLSLVDEVDDASARGRDERALQLSRAAGFRPVGVPFKHMVLVAQISGYDTGRALEILERGGYRGLDRDAVSERLGMARQWLETFAPEDVKVEVPEEIPESVNRLDDAQKRFLADLAAQLPGQEDPEQIHALIRRLATESEAGPGAKRGFEAIYHALLGRDRGPRAANFIAFLGPASVAERLSRAASR